ncbi:SAC3/GANP/Nin1/mts3/eIF-3 p25 family-domain-containing protein [Haematococcus lacustris]
MTLKLTEKIKAVEGAGRMWLVDWDVEMVPALGGTEEGAGGKAGVQGQGEHLHSPRASDREGQGAGGLRSKRARWEEAETSAASLKQDDVAGWTNSRQQAGKSSHHQKQQQHFQHQVGKKQKKKLEEAEQSPLTSVEKTKAEQRAGRFGDGRARGGLQSWQRHHPGRAHEDEEEERSSDGEEFDLTSVVIKGTCTDLEKSYFRLTAAPDASVVRSEPVLRKALDRLVGLMQAGSVNWFYACDQLKGIRQDCTVQHLRNELAVSVYETHARAALEYGDMAEYNQCQTQLASLYADGVAGCAAEFTAYRVIYNAAHARAGANKALLATMKVALAMVPSATASSCSATSGTASLPSSQAAPAGTNSAAAPAAAAAGSPDPEGAVANALRARAAAFNANYPAFFAAYATAPGLQRALLDLMAPRLRWAALNLLVKVYKAALPLSFVSTSLGFGPFPAPQPDQSAKPLPGCSQLLYPGKLAPAETREQADAACIVWLRAHGAVVDESDAATGPVLDVKASLGKLFIPEEVKVSHGDDNLSLEDFLSRASGLGGR